MGVLIKPTVGRQVHYWPGGMDLERVPSGNMLFGTRQPLQPMAATVVYVWDDRKVNLLVTDHSGFTHPKHQVQLLQEDDAKPEDVGFACWMPYQTAVAAGAPPVLHPGQDAQKAADLGAWTKS